MGVLLLLLLFVFTAQKICHKIASVTPSPSSIWKEGRLGKSHQIPLSGVVDSITVGFCDHLGTAIPLKSPKLIWEFVILKVSTFWKGNRYSQIFCRSTTCIFVCFPITNTKPTENKYLSCFLGVPAGAVFFSKNYIFTFPSAFNPSRINWNLSVYNKWNGYWVFDQEQSSGLVISSICWNLMSFNFWE